MAHGRYYRRRRFSSRSYTPRLTERDAIFAQYSGLEQPIRRLFFALDRASYYRLLNIYQEAHGERARDYAEKTYPKWQNGQVRMSGQVAERLIHLLPRVLGADGKYGLVKHLRDQNRRQQYASFNLQSLTGLPTIRDGIRTLIEKHGDFQLPEFARSTLSWLASDDSRAAENLLRVVAEREGRDALRQVDADLERLTRLVLTTLPGMNITFEVNVPQLRATIYAKGAQTMSDDRSQPQPPAPPSTGAPAVRNAGELLTQSWAQLNKDDQARLARTANEEALRLQVRDLTARLDGKHADSDIERFVSTTDRLSNSQGVDFQVSHEVKTESGKMNIRAERRNASNNQWLPWVIGLVVVVLLFLVFRKH